MAEEKLLTVREVAAVLGVSEKEVVALSENGSIPAYKVGGVFLRFKREQVQEYLKRSQPLNPKPQEQKNYPAQDRLSDFFYFNDFYILAALIIVLLLVIIFRGY
jgi:excisionase family DNA binding protein